jgi:hypothetical protein
MIKDQNCILMIKETKSVVQPKTKYPRLLIPKKKKYPRLLRKRQIMLFSRFRFKDNQTLENAKTTTKKKLSQFKDNQNCTISVLSF